MFNAALIMLLLVAPPHTPRQRIEEIARVIASASTTRQDVAILVTISLYENGVGRGGVPFGITSAYRPGMSLYDCARIALHSVRLSQRVCSRNLAVALGRYHTGRCRADGFSRRETRTIHRLLRGLRAP